MYHDVPLPISSTSNLHVKIISKIVNLNQKLLTKKPLLRKNTIITVLCSSGL